MAIHPSRPRRSRRIATWGGFAILGGALALTLSACGGANASAPTPSAQSSTNSGAPNTPPGVFGTAAAISGSTIQVQNPTSGEVTVNFTSATTFTTTVSATLQDVTMGSCVTVSGSPAGQSLTATNVTISQPGTNGCAAKGRPGGNGATPPPSTGNRPTRNAGTHRAAFGSVTAINGATFTVHSTNNSGSTTDTTVTVNSSTKYDKTESANASAVTVGVCIAANGPADNTGAVTAKSIAITQPGPQGCATGAGRFGANGAQHG